MLIGGLLLAVGLGVIIWAIASARENAAETADQRTAVEDYTAQVRVLVQQVTAPVGEMAAAPVTEDDPAIEDLRDSAKRWAEALTQSQAQLGGLVGTAGLQGATDVFQQSLLLYLSAADTYKKVPKLHGKAFGLVLDKANELRDRATGVFESGLAVMEAERQDLGLDPSGLIAPGGPVPQPQPTLTPGDTATEPLPDENAGGGGGKGRGKGKGKGGGDRKDSGGG